MEDAAKQGAVPESAGQAVERLMKERGWNQVRLARESGYSRPTINLVINGHMAISVELATRLGSLFGLPPDYFLDKQDEFAAQVKDGDDPKVTNLHSHRRRQNPDAMGLSSTILVDHQIRSAIESGEIGIDPNISEEDQPASVDMHIGGQVVLSDHEEPVNLRAGETVELMPNQRALVQTLETLRLSKRYLGRIGATSTLARHAIFISTGLQIDPGYEGRIFVSVCNLGVKPFPLRHGSPFLSLEIHRLSVEPLKGYGGPHQGGWEISRFDAEVILASRPVVELGDNDTVSVTDLADDFIELCTPLEIPVVYTGRDYRASLWAPKLTAHGDTREEAAQALVRRMLIRFEDFLEDPSTDPRAQADHDALAKLFIDHRSVAFKTLRQVAERLEADFPDFGRRRTAIVLDGAKRELRIDIPPGNGSIPLMELADMLGITAKQCRQLVAGAANHGDFLNWTAETA